MIDIVGLNVNAFKAGDSGDRDAFITLMNERQPDLIAFQELFQKTSDLSARHFAKLSGYEIYATPFESYRGVAIASRTAGTMRPPYCKHDICKGRMVVVDYPSFSIASIYAPSPSNTDAIVARSEFLRCLAQFMRENCEARIIVVGDFNVTLSSHDTIRKESKWISRSASDLIQSVFDECGWFDTYRAHKTDKFKHRQTIWTEENFSKGAGFGIDFQLASKALRESFVDASIIAPESWAKRYSDHAVTTSRFRI